MQVETVPLSQLHEDAANVRVHDERNIEAIKASLTQFEQVEPLIVQRSTNRVIGGNGRLRAMREMGWASTAVVFLDISNTQATALAIALNRSSELAKWDYEFLGPILKSLQSESIDLATLGWSPDEVAPLLAADFTVPALTNEAFDKPVKMGTPIQVTPEQRELFLEAMDKVRGTYEGPPLTEGRALELICADFLGGA